MLCIIEVCDYITRGKDIWIKISIITYLPQLSIDLTDSS